MELLLYLADVTARSLGLAALALLALCLFRVRTAAARHAAWSAVAACMLALAILTALAPSIPIRVLRPEPAGIAVAGPAAPLEIAPPLAAAASRLPSARPAPIPRRWSWPGAAAALYGALAAFLLVRLGYGYRFTNKLVKAAARLHDAPAGLPESYESSWISVPMTVGWLRPKILLPAAWREWDRAKLDAVLAHECAHIARADWAMNALAAVNRSLFWFNPLAWWMERKLASLAEEACDDAALLATGSPEIYAQALLEMAASVGTAKSRMVWEAMAMARTAEIRKRIERVLDRSRAAPRGMTRARWVALAACTLPLLYLAAAARLAPAQSPPGMPQSRPAAEETAQSQPAPPGLEQPAPAPPERESKPAAPAPPPGGSRQLVLYFDLQGMSSADRVRAQASAETLLNSPTTAADKIAVMIYAGSLKVLQDFTTGRDQLLQAVRNLPASGAQARSDYQIDRQLASLESAVRMLGSVAGKKLLLYFGDGMSHGGAGSYPQLRAAIDAAERANVALFPVDVNAPPPVLPDAGAPPHAALVQFEAEIAETDVRASAQAPYPYRLLQAESPVQTVAPVYPPTMLSREREAKVLVRAVAGVDGRVRSAEPISGPMEFRQAAKDAVMQYLYKPAIGPDGEPAEIDAVAVVDFRLKNVVTGATGATFPRSLVLAQLQADWIARPQAAPNAQPRVISKVNPEYPYALRAANRQGSVTAQAVVGVNGVLTDIRITRSDPAFDALVLAALKQWRFDPARKDGMPVLSSVTLPFIFELE